MISPQEDEGSLATRCDIFPEDHFQLVTTSCMGPAALFVQCLKVWPLREPSRGKKAGGGGGREKIARGEGKREERKKERKKGTDATLTLRR